MAMFPANPTRLDPYKNFKFRIKWDGAYVAAVSKVGGMKRTTEVVSHRAGGDPSTDHKSPGRAKYEAITLDRGLTMDLAFHDHRIDQPPEIVDRHEIDEGGLAG